MPVLRSVPRRCCRNHAGTRRRAMREGRAFRQHDMVTAAGQRAGPRIVSASGLGRSADKAGGRAASGRAKRLSWRGFPCQKGFQQAGPPDIALDEPMTRERSASRLIATGSSQIVRWPMDASPKQVPSPRQVSVLWNRQQPSAARAAPPHWGVHPPSIPARVRSTGPGPDGTISAGGDDDDSTIFGQPRDGRNRATDRGPAPPVAEMGDNACRASDRADTRTTSPTQRGLRQHRMIRPVGHQRICRRRTSAWAPSWPEPARSNSTAFHPTRGRRDRPWAPLQLR